MDNYLSNLTPGRIVFMCICVFFFILLTVSIAKDYKSKRIERKKRRREMRDLAKEAREINKGLYNKK